MKEGIEMSAKIPARKQIIIANSQIIQDDSWPVQAYIDGKEKYLLLLALKDEESAGPPRKQPYNISKMSR